MIAAWSWTLLAGCAGKQVEPEPTPEPVTEESTTAPEPSTAQEAMYKALSLRDDGPSCEEVEAMSETPVDDLVWLTENATAPPWVGTRAATCLIIGHAEEIADLLRTWVTDPDLAGFGALVLGNLGLIPIDLAVEIAILALTEGPDPEAARERVARHDDPTLLAVLEQY